MNRPLLNRFVAAGCLIATAAIVSHCSGQDLPDLIPATETDIRSDDLIRLTTEYSDGVLEYHSANLRLRTLQRLGASTTVTGIEVQLAQLNLATAENKLRILQAIGEKMLALAESRAAFIRRLELEGDLPATSPASPRLQQVEADLRILKMILAMNPIPPAAVENIPPAAP